MVEKLRDILSKNVCTNTSYCLTGFCILFSCDLFKCIVNSCHIFISSFQASFSLCMVVMAPMAVVLVDVGIMGYLTTTKCKTYKWVYLLHRPFNFLIIDLSKDITLIWSSSSHQPTNHYPGRFLSRFFLTIELRIISLTPHWHELRSVPLTSPKSCQPWWEWCDDLLSKGIETCTNHWPLLLRKLTCD